MIPRFSTPSLVLSSVLFAPLAATGAQERVEPLAGVAITELSRREVWSDGRRLTYVRIQPPVLPARAIPQIPPPAEPTPEDLASEARRATKSYQSIALMGGVYVGDATTPTGTEVSLIASSGDTVHRARVFVPLDLRLVEQSLELETSDMIFGYSVFVSVAELASIRRSEWPPELALYAAAASTDAATPDTPYQPPPDYIFEGTAKDAEVFDPILRGLEVLLAHITINRDALTAAYSERAAANAERERLAALQPPPPRDQTIYFWKIATPSTPATPTASAIR